MTFVLMLFLAALAEAVGFEFAWLFVGGWIAGMAYEAMRKHYPLM